MLEHYFALLQELADHLQISAGELLQSEEVVIDDLAVGLTYAGDDEVGDIVFFCDLGSIPKERVMSVQQVLLEANALWRGTSGATLGIHPGSGSVIMCGRVPLEGATAQGFTGVLDVFVDAAQFWRAHIEGTVADDSSLQQPLLTGWVADVV